MYLMILCFPLDRYEAKLMSILNILFEVDKYLFYANQNYFMRLLCKDVPVANTANFFA